MSSPLILTTESTDQYALIDTGNGQKLERFGPNVLVRPDPQALWLPKMSQKEWDAADAIFMRDGEKGTWHFNAKELKDGWGLTLEGISFFIKPASFKHVGLFPEQAAQWRYIKEKITTAKKSGKTISVLNLFGYTGGATLAAAQAGAEVCHVDASKTSVNAARANAELSGLKDAPIRWIIDDVKSFVKREIKRGKKYDAVIMDPPSFGRGAKGEVWKIEEDLVKLMLSVKELLSTQPLFVVLNGYASGYSSLGYKNLLESVFDQVKDIESGELTLKDNFGRLLPAGIFARVIFLEKS